MCDRKAKSSAKSKSSSFDWDVHRITLICDVVDTAVKFGDPGNMRNSTLSRQRRHYGRFLSDNFRPEVAGDVLSGLAEERWVWMST